MQNIAENNEKNKLTPSQFSVLEKVKEFLGNLNKWYKVEKNNLLISDIDLFEIISDELNKDNNNILKWLNHTLTEISFLNNKIIVIELGKGEFIKIINNVKFSEFIKNKIKKLLW